MENSWRSLALSGSWLHSIITQNAQYLLGSFARKKVGDEEQKLFLHIISRGLIQLSLKSMEDFALS